MNDLNKAEEFLKKFKRHPAPPGLRTRLLERMEQRRNERGLLGPIERWLLASSLALIAVASAGDVFLSRSLSRRATEALGWSDPDPGPKVRAWIELEDELRLSNGGTGISPWLAHRPGQNKKKGREPSILFKILEEDINEL